MAAFRFLTVIWMLALLLTNCQRTENAERMAKKANKNQNIGTASQEESVFVVETIGVGYGINRLAGLAVESSQKEVTTLAHDLASHSSSIIRDLKGIGNQKGINMPLEENKVYKRKIASIIRRSGPDFEREWCEELSESCVGLIEKMEEMWARTDDKELREWINNTLPVIRDDLVKLKACHKRLSV